MRIVRIEKNVLISIPTGPVSPLSRGNHARTHNVTSITRIFITRIRITVRTNIARCTSLFVLSTITAAVPPVINVMFGSVNQRITILLWEYAGKKIANVIVITIHKTVKDLLSNNMKITLNNLIKVFKMMKIHQRKVKTLIKKIMKRIT